MAGAGGAHLAGVEAIAWTPAQLPGRRARGRDPLAAEVVDGGVLVYGELP